MGGDDKPGVRWNVRRATPADKEVTIGLMRRAFGEALPVETSHRWDWIQTKNVSGSRMHYLLADAGGKLAGQYTAMPVRMQHAGRELLGLLSHDTATDPDFQRQGVLSALASRLYEEARLEAPIVFGFPNPRSAPVLYKKLDWVELRPCPIFLRPLQNLRRIVRRWKPSFMPLAVAADAVLPVLGALGWGIERLGRFGPTRIVDIEEIGPWADDLWRELAPSLGTCAIRDRAYLQWRFVDSPFQYRRLGLLRGGHIVGFAAFTIVPWKEGLMAYLMELMVPAEDLIGASFLINRAMLEAAAGGASAMWALCTRRHPHRGVLIASGFVPVPRSVSHQSFGVRNNGPGTVPNQLFHIDDWYLSCADFDYV